MIAHPVGGHRARSWTVGVGAAGFTLAELLVVLAILGILAALAYPALAAHVVKARRAEAQVALLELMQMQERYFTRHNSYQAFDANTGGAPGQTPKWYSGGTPASSAYELSGKACPGKSLAHCIELNAIPGTQRVDATFRDNDCQSLMLDSEGRRSASGPAAGCWP